MAVLKLVFKNEQCVGDLVTKLNLSQPKVSLILKELRDLKLVLVKSSGKKRIYLINKIMFDQYISDIKKMLSDFEDSRPNEIIIRRKVLLSN